MDWVVLKTCPVICHPIDGDRWKRDGSGHKKSDKCTVKSCGILRTEPTFAKLKSSFQIRSVEQELKFTLTVTVTTGETMIKNDKNISSWLSLANS